MTITRSRNVILLFFSCILLISEIKCQAIAQGPKKLTDLVAEADAKTNAENSELDKKIFDVFGPGGGNAVTSSPPVTTAPKVGQDGCSCVPYYLCNNGSINTNGEGIIDIRINDGPCESYLEVCCKTEDQATEPIQPTPAPKEESRTGCGYRHADGVGFRITGDKENEAQFGEFPWMVAVLREEIVEGSGSKLNVYQCGGALIHPRAVITAAHCVNGKNNTFKIRAGEWDTQHTHEIYPYQDREVERFTVHPQYYAGALFNDIAILYLKTGVEITKNVETVCLPSVGTVLETPTCYATGWGKDVFGKNGKYQVILKKIDLPIVPSNVCQDRLRTTRLGKYFQLHSSFICAGGVPGKDTCKGDGGSPLVCPIPGNNDDRYYQAGIVSWGIGCGEDNIPGVYVNLVAFKSWIDSQIINYGLDISYYTY